MRFLESSDPNLMAFWAAVFLAGAQVFYRQALDRMSVTATSIGVNSTTGACALVLYLLSDGEQHWAAMGLFWFAMVGVFGAFSGRYLSYLAITYIGLARTHVLAQTMPVWSSLLALLFLGERLSPGVSLGTAAILAGAMLLVWERGAMQEKIPIRRFLIGLLAPAMMATTPAFRKFGLQHLSSPLLGIVVAMWVGASLQVLAWPIARRIDARKWGWDGVPWVLFGGSVNSLGGLCYWTAIQNGDVVAVIPISRLSVLFVLLFSWVFFQRQEQITWRVVAGGLVAVGGAILIAHAG